MAFSGTETTRLTVTAIPGRPQTFSAKGAAVVTSKPRLLPLLGVGT